MPKIGDMFPSKWLRAQDITDLDMSEITLTIDSSLQEEIGPEREPKLVLYFREKVGKHEKALILNKTNIASIVKLYGDDTDDWENQQITLYVGEATFKGESCEAIRIRSKLPKSYIGSGPSRDVREAADTIREKKKPVQSVNQEEHDSDDPPF
jgi:hypothetical protein